MTFSYCPSLHLDKPLALYRSPSLHRACARPPALPASAAGAGGGAPVARGPPRARHPLLARCRPPRRRECTHTGVARGALTRPPLPSWARGAVATVAC